MIGPVIQAARYLLLKEAMCSGVILPEYSELELEQLKDRVPAILPRSFFDDYKSDRSLPWDQIIPLLNTPRRLKTALRQTKNAWANLKGEVNLDELLLFEVIRTASPTLIDKLYELRDAQFSSWPSDRDKKQAEQRLNDRFNSAIEGLPDSGREHLRELAKYLISLEGSDGSIRTIGDSQRGPVQSLSRDTIYWDRIWESNAGKTTPTDQAVLQQMKGWKLDQTTPKLPESMETEVGFVDVFERLMANRRFYTSGLQFTDEDLRQLFHETNAINLKEFGSSAFNETGASFIPLWRCLVKTSSSDQKQVRQFVTAELLEVFTKSLSLALDIRYYCVGVPSESWIQQPADVQAIDQKLISEVQSRWADPEKLLACLSSAKMHNVYSLSYLMGTRSRESGKPETDWTWLAPLLRRILDDDPAVVAPICAGLAVGSRHSPSPPEEGESWRVSAGIVPGSACEIFADQEERAEFYERVLDGLRKADQSHWDDLVRAWVQEAVLSLQRWLEKGVPNEGEPVRM